jgi:cobalt-precorrin 5A hydrolase
MIVLFPMDAVMGQADFVFRRIGVCSLTEGGGRLARVLAGKIHGAARLDCRGGVAQAVRKAWGEFDGFIFVMAAGIVVRTIAPLLGDKRTDPCVVVCDELGRFAVSLLSGHLGGGNELARRVASVTEGQPVITTASDTLRLTAFDLWMRETGIVAERSSDVTRLSAILVNQGRLRIFSDIVLSDLPPDLELVTDIREADCIVSHRTDWNLSGPLFLRPKNLVIGVGCNRGTEHELIDEAVIAAFERSHLSLLSAHSLASIDLKADEEGLLAYARLRGLAILFYPKEELNNVDGVSRSQTVFQATGAYGVAEPAALLAAKEGRLLVSKIKYREVTIAIAEKYL